MGLRAGYVGIIGGYSGIGLFATSPNDCTMIMQGKLEIDVVVFQEVWGHLTYSCTTYCVRRWT